MKWFRKSQPSCVDEADAVDELRRALVAGRRVAAAELRDLASGRWSPVASLVLVEADRLDAEALATDSRISAPR